MKKYTIIIIQFTIALLAGRARALPPFDIFPLDKVKEHKGLDASSAEVVVGTADGQLLVWDNTTVQWLPSAVVNLGWDGTTLTAANITVAGATTLGSSGNTTTVSSGGVIAQTGTATAQFGNTTIGLGVDGADYTLTFDGFDADGLITWMEDEDRFDFADDVKTAAGRIKATARLTGTTTLDSTHHEVFCDTDGGAFTVTLPAAPVDGRTYRIINTGSSGNVLTIDENGTALLGSVTTLDILDGDVMIITFETTEGWW